MKLIFVLCFSICILIIDSRKHRILMNDEFYPYLIDKSIQSYSEYFSLENAIFEQIDDDNVKIEGYGDCVKSMVPDLPLTMVLRTQYLEKSAWREGSVSLYLPNVCNDFLDPTRFSYNATKLWTSCPPKKGDKWFVETQLLNILIEVPLSFSKGPWRGYLLFTQGIVEPVTKFGVMFQINLIEVV